jgi:hypothetical protein
MTRVGEYITSRLLCFPFPVLCFQSTKQEIPISAQLPISCFVFPIHKTGNTDYSASHIFGPYLSEAVRATLKPKPFEQHQKFLFKADADSFYFGSHNLLNVVKGCGTNCRWTITSLNSRIHSTTGSRFALDNRHLVNDPFTGRGHTITSFNLKHTPNFNLMSCHLKEFPDHEMPIYLHWLGFPRLRATNYFNHSELATINVVLNLTRLQLAKDDEARETFITEELAKLRLFETKVKGPTAKFIKRKKNHLCPAATEHFAKMFMIQLEKMATCTAEQFAACITPYSTGIIGTPECLINIVHVRHTYL